MSGAALPTVGQPGGMRVFYETGAGVPPASGRTVTASSSTGEVTIKDSLAFAPLPLGVAVGAGITATRVMGSAGIAAVAANWLGYCMGQPVCVGGVVVAGAAAIIADRHRVRHRNATDMGGGTGLGHDAGQASVPVGGYRWDWGPGYAGEAIDYGSACAGAKAHIVQLRQAQAASGHVVSGQTLACSTGGTTVKITRTYNGPFCNAGQPGTCTADDGNFAVSFSVVSVQQCPAYIDPLDGGLSKPAGSAPGPDGKCPTGRYSAISLADAASKIASDPAGLKAQSAQIEQMMKDWLHSGYPCEGCSAPAPVLSGPEQMVGAPKTTTKTDATGTTTTTTETTYPLEYPAPISLGGELGPYKVVRYGETVKTTTTTTPAGGGAPQTTVTTTSTDASGNAVSADEATKKEVTQCDKFPDSLGCAKLGDAPTDVVPKKTPALAYAAEAVSLPSACPPPKVIQGKAYSYAELCTAATNARPFVIIGAMFSSLMLVLAAFRQL